MVGVRWVDNPIERTKGRNRARALLRGDTLTRAGTGRRELSESSRVPRLDDDVTRRHDKDVRDDGDATVYRE